MDAPTTILIEIMLPVRVCEKQPCGDHSRYTAERIDRVANAAPMNCNQAVAFIRLKPELVDLLYASFACQAQIEDLLRLQKIGTIGNLNLEQVRQFKIPLPNICEQKRIAAYLGKADRLIRAVHREALRQAAHLFATLLDQAFRSDIAVTEKGVSAYTAGSHSK